MQQIKWMFYKRRIDGHERRIDDCTSVESTIVQASNRRLNERRIDGYKRRIEDCTSIESTVANVDSTVTSVESTLTSVESTIERASNKKKKEDIQDVPSVPRYLFVYSNYPAVKQTAVWIKL